VAIYVKGYSSYLPESFEEELMSAVEKTKYTLGQLELDKDSEFFPQRSDQKIMRNDTKASIVAIQELIQEVGLSKQELSAASLFVSNGAFVESAEKYFKKIPTIFSDPSNESNSEKKNYEIYRSSPPLVALETLHNSMMSFIGQYAGINNHNFTFGNTSISTFYAVQEANLSLKKGIAENIFVSASNCAGSYSFLSNSATLGYKENWKESNAGGHLLLTNDSKNAKCAITDVNSNKKVPRLNSRLIERNWLDLFPEVKSDLLIHSGAYDSETTLSDQKYCELHHDKVITLFNEFGNMGTSNILVGIIHAIGLLSDTIQIIDIADRDVYGRESLIRIERC
jgi:hypothetical protein